jgi:hypothetical protein
MHSSSEQAAPLQVTPAEHALWNPYAAACWSIVFTPAFGAYLLLRNWEALGEREQVLAARKWYVFSLGLLLVQLLSSAINSRLNSQSNVMHWVAIGYLLVWWLGAAAPQARVVRERFGASYQRKNWDAVLLAAVIVGTGYFAACGLFGVVLVALT